MKKILLILFSVLIYFIVWWVLAAIAIGLNFAVFDRGTGTITAIGSILAFWGSFKFVKWLWNNYFFKKKMNNPPPIPS